MCRLICAFVVRKWHKTHFLMARLIYIACCFNLFLFLLKSSTVISNLHEWAGVFGFCVTFSHHHVWKYQGVNWPLLPFIVLLFWYIMHQTPNLILHSSHIIRTLCTWDTQPDTPFKSHCQDTVHLRHPTWYSIQVTLSGHCAPETPYLILHSRHIIRTLCTQDIQPDTPFKTTLSGHGAPETPNLILLSSHIIRTLCTGDT